MSEAPETKPTPRPSKFLEQSVYRRRRLIDAIKLLPTLGAGLFLTPALILGTGAGSTATRLVYFFFCWMVLILLCATLTRALSRGEEG